MKNFKVTSKENGKEYWISRANRSEERRVGKECYS